MSLEDALRAELAEQFKDEIWKDIPGFPGYQISSMRRVRRVLIMKPRIERSGVQTVNICSDGERHCISVDKQFREVFGIQTEQDKKLDNRQAWRDRLKSAREYAAAGFPQQSNKRLKPLPDFGLPRAGFPPVPNPRQVQLSEKVATLTLADRQEILEYFLKKVPVEMIAKSFDLHEMDIRVIAYDEWAKDQLTDEAKAEDIAKMRAKK